MSIRELLETSLVHVHAFFLNYTCNRIEMYGDQTRMQSVLCFWCLFSGYVVMLRLAHGAFAAGSLMEVQSRKLLGART